MTVISFNSDGVAPEANSLELTDLGTKSGVIGCGVVISPESLHILNCDGSTSKTLAIEAGFWL
ncbi:hypothetical protein [Nostoc sp. MS1]|uniref:hypothetical protein n=1 Tax=Nostoc sp. MS1 TaxID=2764711 RepID=UPI001CC531A5|nr:hypothetical protein [Nostoc sp. MS1]BCL40305.1 hypothetical protein NSMS1_67520 [Nostoc sp. MS1]